MDELLRSSFRFPGDGGQISRLKLSKGTAGNNMELSMMQGGEKNLTSADSSALARLQDITQLAAKIRRAYARAMVAVVISLTSGLILLAIITALIRGTYYTRNHCTSEACNSYRTLLEQSINMWVPTLKAPINRYSEPWAFIRRRRTENKLLLFVDNLASIYGVIFIFKASCRRSSHGYSV